MNGRPSDEAIDRAARTLAAGRRRIADMTPRQQAEAAWHPAHPLTVDQLEDRIRIKRGLDPKNRSAAEAS